MPTDPYGLIASGLPPELAAEAQGLQSRKAIASALLKQGLQPIQPVETKGRFQTAISPFQGLSQLAHAYLGGKGLNEAETGMANIAQRQQKGIQESTKRYEELRQGTPERTAAPGVVDVAQGALSGGGDNTLVSPVIPGVKGDPRAAVAYALSTPYKPLQAIAQKDVERDYRAQEAATAREDRNAQQESMARLTASLRQPSQHTVIVMGPDGNPQVVRTADGKVIGKAPPPKADEKKAAKEEEIQKGRDEMAATVGAISRAYDRLEELNAVVDPSKPVQTNIVNRLATTGPGQFIAGAIGTNAQTERDKISNLRASLMAGLKQVTGMSAQALNSNAELAFYMKMATDPSSGIRANRAAIYHLNEKYKLGLDLPYDEDGVKNLLRIAPKVGLPGLPGSERTKETLGQNPAPKAVQSPKPTASPTSTIPQGIDPKDWEYLTPEQRKLWKK